MTRWKLLAILIGSTGLLALLAYAGFAAVGDSAKRIGLPGLAFISLIHLPVIALTGYAWFRVGDGFTPASPWQYVWARYVREATAEVLPFSQLGGIVAGARALVLTGLGAPSVARSLVADLVIEQIAKLPYVLAGGVLLLTGRHAAPLGLVAYALLPALTLLIAGLIFRNRAAPLLARVARALVRRVPSLRIHTADAVWPKANRRLGVNRRTTTTYIIHTAAWVMGTAETWVVFHLLGLAVTASEAFIIDSLFCGLRTFGFAIPAALGAQEAAYVLVCALFGIPAAPALALSLVRRVREWIVGLPALAIWQLIEGRRALAGLSRE